MTVLDLLKCEVSKRGKGWSLFFNKYSNSCNYSYILYNNINCNKQTLLKYGIHDSVVFDDAYNEIIRKTHLEGKL